MLNAELLTILGFESQKAWDQEWKAAEHYFSINDTIKFRRKEFPHRIHHSFICIEGIIYLVEKDGYIGLGSQAKVKTAYNKKGEVFALKISAFPTDNEPLVNSYLKTIHFIKGETLRLLTKLKNLFENIPQKKECNVYQKFYSIMELQKGHDLFNYIMELFIKKDGSTAPLPSLTNIQKILIAIKLCLQVLDLHRLGILHCDIKPENTIVFINPDNLHDITVKLVDFDYALSLKGQNYVKSNMLRGTPGFIPDEIMLSKHHCHYSSRSDIYSLGITIGEIFFRSKQKPGKIDLQDIQKNLSFIGLGDIIHSDPQKRLSICNTIQKLFNLLCQYTLDSRLLHRTANEIQGYSPLHLKTASDDDVVEIPQLLKNGINPNIKDRWGKTPLHHAIEHHADGKIKDATLQFLVDTLISAGATPLQYDESQCLPIDYANIRGQKICEHYFNTKQLGKRNDHQADNAISEGEISANPHKRSKK